MSPHSLNSCTISTFSAQSTALSKALTLSNCYIHASRILFSVCSLQLFVTWLAKALRSGTSAPIESRVTTAYFCFSIPSLPKYQQYRSHLPLYFQISTFKQNNTMDQTSWLDLSIESDGITSPSPPPSPRKSMIVAYLTSKVPVPIPHRSNR